MESYGPLFKQSVAKDLRCIPKEDVARILERTKALSRDPTLPGCEKRSAQSRYRTRHGDY